jgi:hypothetical protein
VSIKINYHFDTVDLGTGHGTKLQFTIPTAKSDVWFFFKRSEVDTITRRLFELSLSAASCNSTRTEQSRRYDEDNKDYNEYGDADSVTR